MFRPHSHHLQTQLFGLRSTLPETLQNEISSSEEFCFYNLIFCNINEEDFRVLYSSTHSRPNTPVNYLVSSLILKHKYNWTYEQLFKNLKFNILTRAALGLDNLSVVPFDESTMFAFQNRLSLHFVETGVNLLEQVFDKLTATQIKTLKIETDIQRSDSVMASSNIRSYSRTQLLIEVLIRFWKILSQADKTLYKEHFCNYVNKSSGQFIYKLKASDIPCELDKIAELYHFCQTEILPKYKDIDFAKIFTRVYQEHFTLVESKIEIKKSNELISSSLQSPDDLDATYREKRKEKYRGQSINVVETASPENQINLITDVSVNPNNVDDAKVLGDRIDILTHKTPNLKELHTDGAYGNSLNDNKFEELEIEHIQTAIRGRKSDVAIEIIEQSENEFVVNCPLQSVTSKTTKKKFKCLFDSEICKMCPNLDKCPTQKQKKGRIYYFAKDDYLRNKRINKTLSLPPEKLKIRPNVEATMKEFTCRMQNKKLKVRNAFKAGIFAFSTAIAINYGRIFRFIKLKTA